MTKPLQRRAVAYLASAVSMVEQAEMDLKALQHTNETFKNGPIARCRTSAVTLSRRLRGLNTQVESLRT